MWFVKFDVFPSIRTASQQNPKPLSGFGHACPHATRVLLRWCAYAIRCRVTLRAEPVFSNISKASIASLGAGDGEAFALREDTVGSGDGEAWREDTVGSGDGEA